MKIKILLAALLLLITLSLPLLSMAQAWVPDEPNDVDVPIDGGLSLLLAAGVGYGVKKYRDQGKN